MRKGIKVSGITFPRHSSTFYIYASLLQLLIYVFELDNFLSTNNDYKEKEKKRKFQKELGNSRSYKRQKPYENRLAKS